MSEPIYVEAVEIATQWLKDYGQYRALEMIEVFKAKQIGPARALYAKVHELLLMQKSVYRTLHTKRRLVTTERHINSPTPGTLAACQADNKRKQKLLRALLIENKRLREQLEKILE